MLFLLTLGARVPEEVSRGLGPDVGNAQYA